jgi:hypothetical protein
MRDEIRIVEREETTLSAVMNAHATEGLLGH